MSETVKFSLAFFIGFMICWLICVLISDFAQKKAEQRRARRQQQRLKERQELLCDNCEALNYLKKEIAEQNQEKEYLESEIKTLQTKCDLLTESLCKARKAASTNNEC